jgi:hypothetical protein
MEKVERDEKVAVLYSPGFGAGWYTWNKDKRIVFDPRIVEKVEKRELISDEFMKSLGYDGYWGGSRDLEIEWISKGTIFEIEEYDGSESIHIIGEREYLEA